MAQRLDALLGEIRACRLCVTAPDGARLPHEPRPVLQASGRARLAVFGHAPGNLVHKTGLPFNDPSGDRLRDWLGVRREDFYDETKLLIAPMGFCFPGYNEKGADLPPRPECARAWRARLMAATPQVETAVLVGAYAQRWHLGNAAEKTLTATVSRWRDFAPRYFPVPHPSWRNNAWLKQNPWFAEEVLPSLRAQVRALIG